MQSHRVQSTRPGRSVLNLLVMLALFAVIAAAVLAGWVALSRYSISPSFGYISAVLAVIAVIVFWTWAALRGSRTFVSAGMAGNVECPRCASLQTDSEEVPTVDRGSKQRMRCFACEHRWA